MANFVLNGDRVAVSVDADTPLLWVLRENLGKTGTKFGCGAGMCGACTVLIDGNPTRSCLFPVAAAEGKRIDTIEGLQGKHPLQRAWVEHGVPQCGYCQSGQIMSAVALLANKPNPSDSDIDNAMQGNICRCGTYTRIRAAIKSAAAQQAAGTAFYDAAEVN